MISQPTSSQQMNSQSLRRWLFPCFISKQAAFLLSATVALSAILSGCGVSSTDLQVQGSLPGLQIANPVTFAPQAVASPVSQIVPITNTGSVPLLITAMSISGANAANFSETDTCVNASVAAGASCAVTLTFVPAAVGAATATLSITSNAVYGTVSVTLTGTGTITHGTLASAVPVRVASLSTVQLTAAVNASPVGPLLLIAGAAPNCGVDVYAMQYWTLGGAAEVTNASGAIMVPTGGTGCSGARPIVMYAHGTSVDKNYNIANILDPTNAAYGESALLAVLYASHGFIVVAPNYAGYDVSTLGYHPYLNAVQQSGEMLDALSAARSALPLATTSSTSANDQLLVTGYSQGGYVAMATLRALQADSQTVTAVAPGSGPYALEYFGDVLFEGAVNAGGTAILPALTNSYQHAYGDIYSSTSDIYSATYATGIDTLLPTTLSRSALFSGNKLPATAVFNSVAPGNGDLSAALAVVPSAQLGTATATGAAALAASQATSGFGFGSPYLIKNAYRLNYLLDALSNPDPAFVPGNYSAAVSAPVINTFRNALWRNDLRNGDWTPSAPLLMCGGGNDPTVFFQNSAIMQGLWASNPNVSLLNIDSAVGATSILRGAAAALPLSTLQSEFTAAEASVALAAAPNGAAAVLDAYHASLVGTFCALVALDFFNAVLGVN